MPNDMDLLTWKKNVEKMISTPIDDGKHDNGASWTMQHQLAYLGDLRGTNIGPGVIGGVDGNNLDKTETAFLKYVKSRNIVDLSIENQKRVLETEVALSNGAQGIDPTLKDKVGGGRNITSGGPSLNDAIQTIRNQDARERTAAKGPVDDKTSEANLAVVKKQLAENDTSNGNAPKKTKKLSSTYNTEAYPPTDGDAAFRAQFAKLPPQEQAKQLKAQSEIIHSRANDMHFQDMIAAVVGMDMLGHKKVDGNIGEKTHGAYHAALEKLEGAANPASDVKTTATGPDPYLDAALKRNGDRAAAHIGADVAAANPLFAAGKYPASPAAGTTTHEAKAPAPVVPTFTDKKDAEQWFRANVNSPDKMRAAGADILGEMDHAHKKNGEEYIQVGQFAIRADRKNGFLDVKEVYDLRPGGKNDLDKLNKNILGDERRNDSAVGKFETSQTRAPGGWNDGQVSRTNTSGGFSGAPGGVTIVQTTSVRPRRIYEGYSNVADCGGDFQRARLGGHGGYSRQTEINVENDGSRVSKFNQVAAVVGTIAPAIINAATGHRGNGFGGGEEFAGGRFHKGGFHGGWSFGNKGFC